MPTTIHTLPKETILFISVIIELVFLMVKFLSRKWKLSKIVGSILLCTISQVYVYNVFGDITLGDAQPFDDFYYSKIPFGNLIYDNVQFEENIMAQYQHDFFVFFTLTITFFVLFSFISVFFFEINNIKKFWLISCSTFELIQFCLMQLSYRFLISKEYPLVFDTGAFILVPICLGIGIIIGKYLNNNKRKEHDYS